nr:RHS repeat domain-containing protein [Streptomyces odonnellii]
MDDRCRILATANPLGHTTRRTYDPRGNLLTRTDPLGLTTAFSYDEEGRLIAAVRPDGSELRTVRGLFGLRCRAAGRLPAVRAGPGSHPGSPAGSWQAT